MNREDAEESRDIIRLNAEGAYRHILLSIKLGAHEALGLSKEEYARSCGDIKLSKNERKEAVAELAKEGLTQREIGAIVGASHTTVGADLAEIDQAEAHSQVMPADYGRNLPTVPDIPKPMPSTFKQCSREIGKISKSVHAISDQYSEGLDRGQSAELILSLESAREQIQFAIITLSSRFDD